MNSKTSVDAAVHYLQKDSPLSNIDMLEPLRRETADILYAGDDGVILYERNSEACMISMQNTENFSPLLYCNKYRLFAVHQKSIAKQIRQKGGFLHDLEVYQASYQKKQPFEDRFSDIQVLNHSYTDQINQNYSMMDNRQYIDTLIEKDHLWGIFDHGTLAGFIGEHLEGSMGLLEVFPEFQRKGYGYRLETFLINHFLLQDETPFCQVATDNTASLSLQKKIGMDISEQTTTWLFD